jgi:hypothetical protein
VRTDLQDQIEKQAAKALGPGLKQLAAKLRGAIEFTGQQLPL